MSWILDRFKSFGERPVAVDEGGVITYAALLQQIADWGRLLDTWGIVAADRVGLIANYSVQAAALIHALLERGCIVVPLMEDDRALFEERLQICAANKLLTLPADAVPTPENVQIQTLEAGCIPELMQAMLAAKTPGFIIFTSGSTGKGKAVLLDFERMVQKFKGRVRESFRTLLFLKLDHIGGLNTLFSVLFNGGTIVTCPTRQAKEICQCIEKFKVDLLPATPSFLTMLLMSGMHRQHDLSSLKVISYGTEAMPASTLSGLHKALPAVELKQTYGLSELGILATKSKDSSSKWMKIGGDGFQVKVQDNTLWIKSEQAMLGYLNAPSPFDADGWYNTGDKVEVDGEYFQILGRESEIINVAGEKVFPIEVESFLLTIDNVKDVVVRAKKSPVVGQMIWAEFVLEQDEEPAAFKKRVIAACQGNLAPFKVPGYITITKDESFVGSRFKKIRRETKDAKGTA